MAILNSTATTVKQLLQDVAKFLTDAANFSAGNAWQLMRPAVIDASTTEVILKGIGDGKDEIYIGMKIKAQGTDQENILLNGFAGYDANLEWFEQPGSIYQDALPCVPLAKDVLMTYWITANTSRITLHVEMSNHYEAAYLGFFKPVAIERQYPYPMLIGGSAYAPLYARENIGHMRDAYHALGGNGVIEKIYKRFVELPQVPPS